MKAKFFILSLIILSTFGCNKEDDNIKTSIDGNYIGFFERSGNTSNVELTFNNVIWAGESETVKFPALCNGTYSDLGNVMTFKSVCAWTADFDWTLILGGDWSYTFNGNLLSMTKSNGDKYTLTKQ